ncbi:MAG: hypothetical protein MZV70_12180 [Desulfobacterales bacterium]|nr:hypothetical protein [Desulfobacterales bacterium]
MHKLLTNRPGEQHAALGQRGPRPRRHRGRRRLHQHLPRHALLGAVAQLFPDLPGERPATSSTARNEKVAVEVAAARRRLRGAQHGHDETRGPQRGGRRPDDAGLCGRQGRHGDPHGRRPRHVLQPERAGQPLLRQALRAADARALHGRGGPARSSPMPSTSPSSSRSRFCCARPRASTTPPAS